MERILKRYQGYDMNGREIKLVKDCDSSRSRSRSLSRRARSLRSRSVKRSRSRSGSRSRRRSRSREKSGMASSPRSSRSGSHSVKREDGSLKKLDEASLAEHNKPRDQDREERNSEGYEN